MRRRGIKERWARRDAGHGGQDARAPGRKRSGRSTFLLTIRVERFGSSSPRPSPPGEGESLAAALENYAIGLAGQADPKPEPNDGCSFSQGEKVRMRASREELCPAPELNVGALCKLNFQRRWPKMNECPMTPMNQSMPARATARSSGIPCGTRLRRRCRTRVCGPWV